MIERTAEARRAQAASGSLDGPLWRADAAALTAAIRARTISAREVVEATLERLSEVNPALNAVVLTLADEARATADALDARQRAGAELGPLHGVPATIKINIDQRGCPTDNGIIANKGLIAEQDHPVVANLRAAGAILIGRTNAPGYSMRWHTGNALHGETRNPWRADRTCGGSSGGAAVATAAGMAPISHGNDIAGSIRYPAFCCGVFGLKPSYGRVPSYNPSFQGLSPISSQLMAVQGPLTRSVRDLRLAFAAMAKPDVLDPRTLAPAPFPPAHQPIQVALVESFDGAPYHPAVSAALSAAARALEDAGYRVEPASPPELTTAAATWPRLAMPDLLAQLEPYIEKNGDDGVRRAAGLWRHVWPQRDPAEVLVALGERLRLLRLWQLFLIRYPLILMPASTEPAFEVDADTRDAATTSAIVRSQRPMTAVSLLGLPAISAPALVSDGLPIGVQLVAAPFREDLCFDAAEAIEARLPPAFPPEPMR
ncbi:amidase [Bradyrhizobium sp. LTSP885]|uniref:amidase n=1 Tax=Bradyrhizobium sp. LTSP885 TaxID=1619232 RepID=UPI0005E25291|nr:amidase [Bradyrhizobium sp. LTSP885]KJC51254.1 amidase [Bradyrhizobium sp. LTSP885]